MAKIPKPKTGFFTKKMTGTRGEAFAMAGATGMAVGTANNAINQHYVAQTRTKAKTAYTTRRYHGAHGLARKGGVNN